MPLEEDFKILENKLLQLKVDYDQYFLGSRPREPVMLRGEVQKLIAMYSNQAIQNTALRFKFGSICSRYQAYKRQWTEVLRQIEAGTYSRHRFKAELHERERRAEAKPGRGRPRGRRRRPGRRRALPGLCRGVPPLRPGRQGPHPRQARGNPGQAARAAALALRRGRGGHVPGRDRGRQGQAQGVAREDLTSEPLAAPTRYSSGPAITPFHCR